MSYYLLLITEFVTLSLSSLPNPPTLILPSESFSLPLPPLNTTTGLIPWRPVPWSYRIQRNILVIFTWYSDPVDLDAAILTSFRELMETINDPEGSPRGPMEFQKTVFGEPVLDLLPYKDDYPPSRSTFSLILEALATIMNTRGARLFESRVYYGFWERASFNLDWYTPVPHLAIDSRFR